MNMSTEKFPKIHLVSFSEKDDIIKKINSLGGVVLDPQHEQYNNACTHIVVFNEQIKPTERFLSGLAAGNNGLFIWLM